MFYYILSAFLIFCLYIFFKDDRDKKNKSLEKLKNALLSHALLRLVLKDQQTHLIDLNKSNGKNLPVMFGFSTTDGCFNYYREKYNIEDDKFLTLHLWAKNIAIDKYIINNLDTDKKVYKFFDDYIKEIDKTENIDQLDSTKIN